MDEDDEQLLWLFQQQQNVLSLHQAIVDLEMYDAETHDNAMPDEHGFDFGFNHGSPVGNDDVFLNKALGLSDDITPPAAQDADVAMDLPTTTPKPTQHTDSRRIPRRRRHYFDTVDDYGDNDDVADDIPLDMDITEDIHDNAGGSDSRNDPFMGFDQSTYSCFECSQC